VGRRPSVALALWSLDPLLAVAPAGLLRVSQLSVNQRVWLDALGLSVLAGIVVGLEILFDRHRTGRHMTKSPGQESAPRVQAARGSWPEARPAGR
jgi:hypothetical protein